MERPRFSVRLGHALRRYFVAGLAALFPVTVTLFVLTKIFRFLDGLLGQYLVVHIPGLGLILTVLLLLMVGYLSTHFFGQVVFPTIEAWFSRLPLINKIYPAIKQLTRFLFVGGGHLAAFRRVALVEYPRAGLYTLAFVTNETQTSVTGRPETLLMLLVPTVPSPFTGSLVIVPESQVIPLNMSVEDAVKLIVSGGIVASPLEAAHRSSPQ